MASEFPQQTIPTRKKTRDWAIENIDAVDNGVFYNDKYRSSLRRKEINADLMNGKTHKEDMLRLLNPDNLVDQTLNTVPQHHPIINTKFNVLIGEALARRFNPKAVLINPEAVSEKTAAIREELTRRIEEIAANQDLSDQEREEQVAKWMRYYRYDYSHLYEKMANNLLTWAMRRFSMKNVFKDGFKDILAFSEDIYQVYTVAGFTRFRKLNPKRIISLFRGDSNHIEDGDLNIIEDYMSPGQVQEEFYDRLKKDEIKKIERWAREGYGLYADINKKPLYMRDGHTFLTDVKIEMGESLSGYEFGDYVNENGDIRVLRVYWRSKIPFQVIKGYDPVTGEPIEFEASEDYVPNAEAGETAETYYRDEWWYGVKIGEDIYPIAEPYKDQFPDPENPVRMHCGIIGTIYNTNDDEAISLLDRCKNYIYLNDIVWDKLRDAFVSYLGPILQIDTAYKPQHWSFSKWMYFLKRMKLNVVNSFSEGLEGAAKGKLAGNFNTTGKTFNLDMGNYIQRLTEILQLIEYQLSIITGVTKAREGQTHQRETLGGIQSSLAQSSISTEEMYADQNKTKLRVLKFLLHHMISNLGDKPEVLQEILDDGSLLLFEIDPKMLKGNIFNVVIVDENDTAEMRSKMENLAHAAMQNDKVKFSTLVNMVFNPSLIDVRHKIAQDEDEANARNQENFKMAEQTKQAQIQAEKEVEDRKLNIENAKSEREMYVKLEELLAKKMTDDKEFSLEEDISMEELRIKRDELLAKIRKEERELRIAEEKNDIERAKVKAMAKSKEKSSTEKK